MFLFTDGDTPPQSYEGFDFALLPQVGMEWPRVAGVREAPRSLMNRDPREAMAALEPTTS